MPLGRALCHLLNFEFVISWANLIIPHSRMDQLRVLLANQLTSLVLFIAEYVIVGRDRRWIGLKRIDHAFVPLIVVLLLLDPFGLLVVLARAGGFGFGSEFTALEALYSRRKARMWLHKLDAELVQTEALQGLRTLHVSLDLIKSIRNCVTSRA